MRKPFKVRSRLVFMTFFHEPKVPNEYLVRSLFCFILLYNSWFLRCTFSRRLNAEHKQSRGHKRYRNMNKEKYRNMNKDKFSKNPLPKKGHISYKNFYSEKYNLGKKLQLSTISISYRKAPVK